MNSARVQHYFKHLPGRATQLLELNCNEEVVYLSLTRFSPLLAVFVLIDQADSPCALISAKEIQWRLK
jgi:hypothetical protein